MKDVKRPLFIGHSVIVLERIRNVPPDGQGVSRRMSGNQTKTRSGDRSLQLDSASCPGARTGAPQPMVAASASRTNGEYARQPLGRPAVDVSLGDPIWVQRSVWVAALLGCAASRRSSGANRRSARNPSNAGSTARNMMGCARWSIALSSHSRAPPGTLRAA